MTKQAILAQGTLSLKSTRAYFNQKLIGVMREEVFATNCTKLQDLVTARNQDLVTARKHLIKIINLIDDTIESRSK